MGKWLAKFKKWPVGIRSAIVLGLFTVVAAGVTGGMGLWSNGQSNATPDPASAGMDSLPVAKSSHVQGDNIVNQGSGNQIVNKDSTVTIQHESDEAAKARKEAEIAKKNRAFFVGVSKWIKQPYTSPNGRKRIIRRPEITSVPSATKPEVTFDKEAEQYNVKVSKYVLAPDADEGMRLEWRSFESDGSFGEPVVEENIY